jgi:glycosyltransferase involved in cell wall biosynthesis
MTVCIVTHCYPLHEGDVPGNFLPDFSDALRQEGHRVLILTPEMRGAAQRIDNSLPLLRSEGVRTFAWSGGERRLGELKPYDPFALLAVLNLFRRGATALVDLIRAEGVDFCLAAWAIPGGFLCRRARARTGVPYAVWSLGSDVNVYGQKPILRRVVRRVLADADLLFANSRGLIRAVESLTGRIPGFMPTNRLLPKAGIPDLDLGAGRRHLLFVGRLEPVKGIDLLVQAVARLAAEGADVDLHVLGDGSVRKALERDVLAKGLQGRIFFKGFADGATVAAHLRACDLLVIPSRSEGLPVVFHEAMQVGTPVAATDVGDLGEVIREYGVGVLAPSVSPEGIAGAVAEALRLDRAALTARADEVWRRFDIRASARTFSEAIRGKILTREGGRSCESSGVVKSAKDAKERRGTKRF